MIKSFFLCLILISFSSAFSYAEEKSTGRLKTEEIFQPLDDEKRDKFSRVLAAHSLINSITYTKNTVEKAVKSCSEHHPDLGEDIQKSFRVFQESLDPILKKAKKAFSRTLSLEEVLPLQNMKDYLSLLDQEALEYHKKINPIPISSEKECQNLLPKLQDEQKIVSLKDMVNKSFGFDLKQKNP